MAQLTEAELNAKIAAIDTELDALVANPQVDYKIGSKTVSAGQKQKHLLELREHYVKMRSALVEEEAVHFGDEITSEGEDKTEYQED